MKKNVLFALLLLFVGGTAFAQLNLGADKPAKKSDLNAQVPLDKKIRWSATTSRVSPTSASTWPSTASRATPATL